MWAASRAMNNNNHIYNRGEVIGLKMWRLAFICFTDPSALNKVQVRLVLLEQPRDGGGSMSLGFFRGEANQDLALPSNCRRSSGGF